MTYLHLITGPMFAGKSTRLLGLISKLSVLKNIFIINSTLDNRYNNDSITTHSNYSCNANSLSNLNLDNKYLQDLKKKYDVIAIDEAQFFNDLYNFVKICLDMDFHVIVCGLNGNYKQEKFGQILDLIPLANNIELLKGYCMICNDGTEGVFTKRILENNTDEIIVGNEDKYMCVCRKHL
jgi:thymidine kinase